MTSPDNAFRIAVRMTLAEEGVFSHERNDPGGKTKFGITEERFKLAAQTLPNHIRATRIEDLTVAEATIIYRVFDWDALGLSLLDDPWVAAELFDSAVNCGHAPAVLFAQRAYNYMRVGDWPPLKEDGQFGPVTLRALNRASKKYQDALLLAMNCEQYIYYKALVNKPTRKFRDFARGWTKRLVMRDEETLLEESEQ